jgi:phosphoglycolate phosphatase
MSALTALLGESPRALLFDLDGTLVDSVPDLAAAIDAMLQDLGFASAGELRTRQWVGNGAIKLVQRALAYARHCDEQAVGDWEGAHQLFLQHYAAFASKRSCLYAGVREALQIWHEQNLRMAVVTNKPRQFVPEILQHFQLQNYFPVVIGGDCLPQRKPEPEPLLMACEQLSIAPDQTIMIGDSRNDVGAARAAEIPVACVTYGYNHGEPIANAKPDLVVDSLMELI